MACVFGLPLGKSESAIQCSCSVKPLATLRGREHRLKENAFYLLNSEEEMKNLFVRAFPIRAFMDAPTFDFERCSVICIVHKRTKLLTALDLGKIEVVGNKLRVYYVENWIANIIDGYNDQVAEAPYLLLVIPKFKGNVEWYRRDFDEKEGDLKWILEHQLMPEQKLPLQKR